MPDDWPALETRLRAALGAAINDSKGGFLSPASPDAWLRAGCDLELDILPTLRRFAKTRKPQSVFGWGFFDQIVIEARDRRRELEARMRAPPGGRTEIVEGGSDGRAENDRGRAETRSERILRAARAAALRRAHPSG